MAVLGFFGFEIECESDYRPSGDDWRIAVRASTLAVLS
jgi:hypothetical protein